MLVIEFNFNAFSLSQYCAYQRGAQDGRIDGGCRLDRRPRASMPYSLSAVLFLTGPIPFVNEEDFRSPLGYWTSFAALVNPLWSRSKIIILR
jgi:hypothetical protein